MLRRKWRRAGHWITAKSTKRLCTYCTVFFSFSRSPSRSAFLFFCFVFLAVSLHLRRDHKRAKFLDFFPPLQMWIVVFHLSSCLRALQQTNLYSLDAKDGQKQHRRTNLKKTARHLTRHSIDFQGSGLTTHLERSVKWISVSVACAVCADEP